MRTLIIVHLEPDFKKSAGEETLINLVYDVVKYARQFDNVINVTSARGISGTRGYYQLDKFEEREWIWGFDPCGNDYTHIEGESYISTTGHEYSYIEDWMKELPKDHYYTLVGGARSECLQDVFEIFKHLNLKVKIKETLTY